ncbi:MAG: hypothetical protein K2W82_13045 [Candidatus Obscuribacterales bacterium]|nr:hypothetical protein [Candidatus Obscuribacterales bacterium]
MRSKVRSLASGLILLALASFGVPALADPPKPPPPTSRGNPHPTSEYDTTHVNEPPAIGLLPQYTGQGAKFDNGLTYPNLKGTICYTLRYHVKEPQSAVQEWYCSNLPSYGWVINQQQLTDKQIIAKHKKVMATVAIYLDNSLAPGFKTDMLIRYREARTR